MHEGSSEPQSVLRRRLRGLAAGASILATGCYLAAGVHRVRTAEVAMLDSPFRALRVLGPGLKFVLPVLERIESISPFEHDSEIQLSGLSGVSLSARFRVTIRARPAGALGLLALCPSRGGTPTQKLSCALDVIASRAIHQEELRDRFPDLVWIASSNLPAAISPFAEILGEVSLDYTAASLAVIERTVQGLRGDIRQLDKQTGIRVLLVGLDGADWQIAEPLMRAGRLPTLSSLRRRAAWGNVRSMTPMLSPLLWSTVATGVTPERHGIVDFLVPDPITGRKVPVSSRMRRARALWNLFSESGRTVDIVAWWASWPAEPINGHMVSDRTSYSLFDVDSPEPRTGITYPPSYFNEIRPLLRSDDSVSYEEVSRFADISKDEFRAARSQTEVDRATAYKNPINHLAKILAATQSYHQIALKLLREGPADLTAVYYQGIDEVCHRFIHFSTPRLDSIDPSDVVRYGRVVERFYEYQDALLGELLRTVGPRTVVIVLSDHGFLNGPDRPSETTADIEGKPGRWHRAYGIILLADEAIQPGKLDTVSLLDVAPTILYLGGLPVPRDFPGRILKEAVTSGFAAKFSVSTIPTYELSPLLTAAAPRTASTQAIDSEIVESLRSLGYIGGASDANSTLHMGGTAPAAQGGVPDTVTAHSNLAGVYLAKGDLQAAEPEIQAALALAPRYPLARQQLFELRTRQKRFDDAIEVAEMLMSEVEDLSPRFLIDVAVAYRDSGGRERGISFLTSGVSSGRWRMGIPLARLHWESGNPKAAEGAAREVLSHDTLNDAAMATLFLVAQADGSEMRLEPLIAKALEVNGRSVMHLNWFAVVQETRGDAHGAERSLRAALEASPDHPVTQANLGGLLLRSGRLSEALAFLERAVRQSPSNVEAGMNLGSTLARSGRLDDAIAQFKGMAAAGLGEPTVSNALAKAYLIKKDTHEAARWLRRSIVRNPSQTSIRSLLVSLEAGQQIRTPRSHDTRK